jgi:hypothetical protein
MRSPVRHIFHTSLASFFNLLVSKDMASGGDQIFEGRAWKDSNPAKDTSTKDKCP